MAALQTRYKIPRDLRLLQKRKKSTRALGLVGTGRWKEVLNGKRMAWRTAFPDPRSDRDDDDEKLGTISAKTHTFTAPPHMYELIMSLFHWWLTLS